MIQSINPMQKPAQVLNSCVWLHSLLPSMAQCHRTAQTQCATALPTSLLCPESPFFYLSPPKCMGWLS